MIKKTPKRVVITGLGIITSIGETMPSFENALFDGKCGIDQVSIFDTQGFPTQTAGQVKNNDLKAHFQPRDIKRASRCDLLGLIAAEEAFSNAGNLLERYQPDEIGVVLGGGAGGMLSWENYRRTAWEGNENPEASPVLAASPGTLTDLIGNRYGLSGIRSTVTTACSSSATAIGYGFDLIRSKTQKVVISGGSESLSELTFAGFNSLKVTDPYFCRPFDKNRQGISLGEGASILVLEDYHHARDRGAKIWGEVMGYAINSDAFHLTSPDPSARGVSRVMITALENSSVQPSQVDYINAHGTATKINDKMETKAIKNVFGKDKAGSLAISSTKSMVGHCLGASGAIEAAATILALQNQMVPPTIHYETSDPECDLDYVPNHSRAMEIRIALSNSFAFGGNNTSIVFGRAPN
ncbi:MAG: beta-ketoacyl-[acyl-carrier-protein] synthase family protein [Deltaproteobacteria bacterium]|nr:beta-ketoacyl-[acyl-carrier-protein] synthase family protein [Deltaproteobacteria bacterium]MBW1983638.1 beta-ketoacyl-[acyl-carrier-protein] synthase family protein [Deltaproteobacteria bacterium]